MDKTAVNAMKERWKDIITQEKRFPHNTLSMGYLDMFDQLNTATAEEVVKVADQAAKMFDAFLDLVYGDDYE